MTRSRAEKLQPHIQPGDIVFEYGAGSGWNLAALQCAEKIGYDITDFLAPELAKLGIRFVDATSALADGFADCAICHHTLEHVIAPPDVLAELKRLLKPNGKLLLFVPFEKERRYRSYHPGEPNHHLYSWNAQTIGNLVAECGWNVESVRVAKSAYDRFAAVNAAKFKLGEPGFRIIRALVHLYRPGLEVQLIARPRP